MSDAQVFLVALLIFCGTVDGGDLSCDSIARASKKLPNRTILIEFFGGSPLYSAPGSTYVERVYVTNQGHKAVNVSLTHRENFIQGAKHSELVRGIRPKFIFHLQPNHTKIVEVLIEIPDYVKIGAQSKVTLVVQNINLHTNGQLEIVERSFFFTVSRGPLTIFDRTQPDCGRVELCPDYDLCLQGSPSQCNTTHWTAVLETRDNLTGLFSIEPLTEDVRANFLEPIFIGTTAPTKAVVRTNCCQLGLKVLVVDLAENTATCTIGQLPSSGEPKPAHSRPLLAVFFAAVIVNVL